ncbi:phosphotransferase [Nocardioides bigeumensis]|uniref:Nudix hydrolase domain-containing protein n=1 Tax=Nocardioides bigeumensis TaxID=433657 RepID=A0ABN2XZM6_9ACTN
MVGMDEVVALYDDSGRPVGAAPRSRMRAENLRHAATGVVVRDPLGRVFVHRRTDTKDVYPGRYDFTAGGVLLAGEDPVDAARREAEEELGVSSPLVPLGEADYADDHTSYHAFLFETTWDGPVRLQPEEVASGEWLTLEQLAAMLDDPTVLMMPDARALLGPWLRERLADRVEPEQGWDSHTVVVEGRWVDRTPQRPDVAPRLRAETVVLPRLAPLLPVAVPVPVVVETEPLRVRHPIVPGEPCDPEALTAEDGRLVGELLQALHATPPEVYAGSEVPDGPAAYADLLEVLGAMRERVLPMLPADRRAEGARLLDEVAEPPTSRCLVHGDLGPTHVLVLDGRVHGIIDWSDMVVGDPAHDLAWTLNGTPPEFADALAAAYGVTPELRARGLLWQRLGPWFEVLGGVDFLGQEYVDSGLEGVLARL